MVQMHRYSLRFDKSWHNLGQKMSGQFSSKQTLGFCRIIKWALDKRFYPIRNTPPPGGVGYRLGQFTRGSQSPAGISNGIYQKKCL